MSTFAAKHAILRAQPLSGANRWQNQYPQFFSTVTARLIDHGYVHEIDNFEFIDGVIDAMRQLKEMGYALVVVTTSPVLPAVNSPKRSLKR
jgi:beta-phosphoglucomutase-like phosphatase (HAD superfamily)